MKLIECENMEKETVYIPESYLNIGVHIFNMIIWKIIQNSENDWTDI